MKGKLAMVGFGLAAGALAYGYAKQQEHLFSLKAQMEKDTDLDRYCKSGPLTIENNLFRLKLTPK